MEYSARQQQAMRTIGESPAFYGYVVGLVSRKNQLLVTFEYNDDIEVWIVPDAELFRLLADHLCGNAQSQHESDGEDFGYNKVWIEKIDGKWSVTLP